MRGCSITLRPLDRELVGSPAERGGRDHRSGGAAFIARRNESKHRIEQDAELIAAVLVVIRQDNSSMRAIERIPGFCQANEVPAVASQQTAVLSGCILELVAVFPANRPDLMSADCIDSLL